MNDTFSHLLMNGLNDNSWGYGMKRVSITPPKGITYPYVLSGFGYKNTNGEQFVGLRAYIDQSSPPKMRPWPKSPTNENILIAWSDMLAEFLKEYNTSKANMIRT